MTENSKEIAILGCGWLGLPLAEILVKKGRRVKGSTTTPSKLNDLKAVGIDPYLLKVQPTGVLGDITTFLSTAEVLIIDFPPGIRKQKASEFIGSIQHLTQAIKASSLRKVLFISSISVYEDTEAFPEYTEQNSPNATSERGRGLIAAEEMLAAIGGVQCSILRLAGLVGGMRHPVVQLSGREGIANPEAPINLIHRNDCIGIIESILEKEGFGEIFNAAYPEHPKKEEYYRLKAEENSLALPNFSSLPSKGKIIDSSKLRRVLEYNFTTGI